MTKGKGKELILVTGATGRQGGAVARRLAAAGWPVRALVRDPAKSAARRLTGLGIELSKGDLEDRASLDRALAGVYGVFSVQAWRERGVDAEVRMGKNLADASRAAGVAHFIYSSVGGVDRTTGIPWLDSKHAIEEHVRTIGLPYTIFRPVYFMHNFNSPEVRASLRSGVLACLLRPDRSLQMLAVEDLGEFVKLAFEQPEEYLSRTIELAGDELTMPETAAALGRNLGRPVRYLQQPVAEIRRFNPDFARMEEWFHEHGYQAAIAELRRRHPRLMSLETWLKKARWVAAA